MNITLWVNHHVTPADSPVLADVLGRIEMATPVGVDRSFAEESSLGPNELVIVVGDLKYYAIPGGPPSLMQIMRGMTLGCECLVDLTSHECDEPDCDGDSPVQWLHQTLTIAQMEEALQ